ncbi:YkgJ family cysteine cluster protein [Chloroflexota bacterium]
MDNKIYDSHEIDKLDLEKYGLSYLEGNNLLSLSGPDMEKLLNALGKDDISLNVPIPCTPDIVQEVLSFSECRRCGGCCTPNPLNPDSPGVEVFKDELGIIADHLHMPYETLEMKTSVGKVVPYPFQVTKLSFTRWLPLPCPFHIAEPNGCRVYPVRPVVCKIHPIIFTGDESYMSIKTNCDYGKELIIAVFKLVRTRDPNLEILL